MALLERVRIAWTGFAGGPGVSTLYFQSAGTAIGPLHTLCDQMRSKLPTSVTLVIEPTGDIIDSATGQIQGSWVGAAQAASVGSVGGPYAAPAGFGMTWFTDSFLSGRRLRGRTYWVPATSGLFDTDGSLNSIAYNEIAAAAAGFVAATAGNFMVWQRPRVATPATPTRPAVIARSGGFGTVTSSRVTDKVVVLRSRRD